MTRLPLLSLLSLVLSLLSAGCQQASVSRPAEPNERHLKNIRQLTFVGENAEAYFSGDGGELVYQARRCIDAGLESLEPACDQIFLMSTDGFDKRMVSTGKGRTTCSYFLPDGSRIVYASTHLGGDECPPEPKVGRGRYVWPVYGSYDIYSARPDGSDLRRLTTTEGYDAEATVSPDGSQIVFTSARDGDLELYTMKPDGSDQRRITHTPGYDGGGFFSPDGTKICFRASRPKTPAEHKKFRDLLAQELVEPSALEIFVADSDGSNIKQVTKNGAANFCPFFHPSGKKIIYASNKHSRGRGGMPNFDLFMVDLETGEEERVTYHEAFDGFPMFSPDGKQFVWCSNRFAANRGDTNIFIADWVDEGE